MQSYQGNSLIADGPCQDFLANLKQHLIATEISLSDKTRLIGFNDHLL